MDHHRFDTLVKQLSLLRSRRGALAALASTGLALFTAPLGREPGGAARRRRKRKKKKNRGHRGERCRGGRPPCAALTEECNPRCVVGNCCLGAKAGCCDIETGLVACQAHVKPECAALAGTRCCSVERADCSDDCDCCGPHECVNGKCGCALNGESCRRSEECCGFPDLFCTRNSCDQQGVCCSEFGVICDPQNGDCDCCFPLKCQDDQTCRCIFNNQDTPCEFDRDCCFGNVCFDRRCCVPPGGSCVRIEKCCDGHVCRFEPGRNVGECVPPACPDPGQRQRRRDGDRVAAEGAGTAPCQVGDLVVCCQEEGDCCTLGPEPDCCEADEECTAQGCVAPTCATGNENDLCLNPRPPDPLPCGEDAVDETLCFCFGDVCARDSGCIGCASDADCAALPFFGAESRCVSCPQCQPGSGLTTRCVKPCR